MYKLNHKAIVEGQKNKMPHSLILNLKIDHKAQAASQ